MDINQSGDMEPGAERMCASVAGKLNNPVDAIALVSIAISMKRVADALEGEPLWPVLMRIAATLESREWK